MRPWDLDRSEKDLNFVYRLELSKHQQSTCECESINIWINLRGLSTQDTAALVANSKMSKASLLQNTLGCNSFYATNALE